MLTVKQVIQANVALTELVKADKENKFILPSAVRIKLAGNLRKTRPVSDEYLEAYNLLVERLGEQVEGAPEGSLKVKKENIATFKQEHKDALAVEKDITLTSVKQKDILGDDGDGKKSNQIPVDLLADLIEVGVIQENE